MHSGAASLSAWQGKEMDGFALWGLHSSACGELAEAVALCLEALHVFGIEAAGSAAAKRGSPVPPDAFSSIADYLQAKVLQPALLPVPSCGILTDSHATGIPYISAHAHVHIQGVLYLGAVPAFGVYHKR